MVSRIQLHNFIVKLFDPLFDGFQPETQYWITMLRWFSTFLMHFDASENLVGISHPVVQRCQKEALACSIDSKMLWNWGKLLLSKWEMDKHHFLPATLEGSDSTAA